MTTHARQFSTPARSQPWWYAALCWLTHPLPSGSFEASAWIERAVDAVGQTPAPDVRDAFEALVSSLQGDARLGAIGRIAARDDCVRKLLEHLRARARQPQTVQAPDQMPQPVYVLGWMRSGTTALHRLLAADPDTWTPKHHETMFPVPPEGRDDRPERTAAVLAELSRVSPGYQAIHPMQPDNPEECVNLFTHAFRTPQFAVQYRVPSYLRWLEAQDPALAYGRYVHELGILRHGRGGGARMLLKDPTHMGYLPALTAVFPAAKFIFIHRDPVDVFSSMSSMYAHTRAIFSRDVDPMSIGPELFDTPLLQAHADGLAFCDGLEPGRVAHVRHEDVRRDPLAAARGIYDALGLAWTEVTEAALRRHAAKPRPDHRHDHDPAAFGLDPDAMRERLGGYRDRFGL